MKKKAGVLFMIFVAIFIFSGVTIAGQGNGERLVLNLKGSGDMYESTVPDIDGDGYDDSAICFDTDLINMRNLQVVGTATDCLSNITPMGDGLALVGTTYFHLPQGTLITRGNTTVQPALHPTVTPSGQPVTHITGAADDGNGIIGGTGSFMNSVGTVRLSGMVDMTNFDGNVGEPIVFDCLFVIEFN